RAPSVACTAADAANYTTTAASVSVSVLKATPTVTWPTPANITYGTPLSATQLNATSSVPGTFVYTPAAGTVLDAGSHPVSVTFTPTDATNYTTCTETVSITVLKAPPTIAWPAPADITFGTALSAAQLNATSGTPGTLLYTPASGTVLNAGSHTLSVTTTPADAANHTVATATVNIAVLKATPSITWPAPADITFGTALSATHLNATASVDGTFVYTPAAGTVLDAGPHTLSVTFTPTDAANYTMAMATVASTVSKATPTVAWPTPADIVYGTALSAIQLHATTTTPETF